MDPQGGQCAEPWSGQGRGLQRGKRLDDSPFQQLRLKGCSWSASPAANDPRLCHLGNASGSQTQVCGFWKTPADTEDPEQDLDLLPFVKGLSGAIPSSSRRSAHPRAGPGLPVTGCQRGDDG